MTISTVAALRKADLRLTMFADGGGGKARQEFQAVDEPRLGAIWRRQNRLDEKGSWTWLVDGREVESDEEVLRLLALPAPADAKVVANE